MKTAMQELIEYIDSIWSNGGWEETIKEKATELLEKEKEQIIADFEAGYKSCDLDEAFEINRKLSNGELYYKKTYGKA